MSGIASSTTWKIEVLLPSQDAAETFGMALDALCFAAAAFEVVPDGPWRLECYCDAMPDNDVLVSAIALASSQAGISEPKVTCLPLPEVDWVAENQKSFKPIRAGRFFVHPSHYDHKVPAGCWRMMIDAATAFGTGEHGTTKGCLLAINDLAKSRSFTNPLDLGCGTGILSMGIAQAWPVTVTAGDIDPEAVRVTRFNARRNGLGDRVDAVVSTGFSNPVITQSGPYDLIVANILANPLKALARPIKRHLQPGGMVILSGLLATQESLVRSAYRAQGLRLVRRYPLDGWMTLVLQR